ncbi:unnamed protein product [Hydatigera taeniaeformis]|uniref:Uncharacterized protein n=1 Tax=Hydatigena taeniaeformis TaxID=6205 RepID=A0A0R3X955_HYDTA|nr:unnamed protein product [Hydatigera taeniaeformis]
MDHGCHQNGIGDGNRRGSDYAFMSSAGGTEAAVRPSAALVQLQSPSLNSRPFVSSVHPQHIEFSSPLDAVCDEDRRFSALFAPRAVAPCASIESLGSYSSPSASSLGLNRHETFGS